MATSTESIPLPESPPLRTTPPCHWWTIPFGELWDYRELLYFIVWRELKVRYAALFGGLMYFQKTETTMADVV